MQFRMFPLLFLTIVYEWPECHISRCISAAHSVFRSPFAGTLSRRPVPLACPYMASRAQTYHLYRWSMVWRYRHGSRFI